MINKKNTSLFLFLSFLNINCSITSSITNETRNNTEDRQPFNSFIKDQANKKYFIPIATTTCFALGALIPVIMNHITFTEPTEIKKILGSIPKKEFALTGLKSLFVASHLTAEFTSNKEAKIISASAKELSLLGLFTVYTYKTFRDLLKAKELPNLQTLFEKLLENYGTIGMVDTLIKGMRNNNTSLIERSKINKYAYYGFLIVFLCLWEHCIKKDFSRDAILKTTMNIVSLAAVTSNFTPKHNDILKKLLILVLLGNATKEFYKNSKSRLEQSEIKLIALEDITAQIGKTCALPLAFNSFIELFNSHFLQKSKKNDESQMPTI